MENINLLVVFIEGILSFFSPCILPILPIYLSMLSSSSIQSLKDENSKLYKSSLLKNTIFFTLGISTTFFILGSSVSALSNLFNEYKEMIMILGGILIIILGLFYIGWIKLNFLQREKRFNMKSKEMNPITAYLLGFTFSFGWTPCIGPMLASVLIMASTSDSAVTGNILMAVYTIGFILPFIVTAIFYNRLFKTIDKIKNHMGAIKKLGGIILIVSGIVMSINGFKEIENKLEIEQKNNMENSQSKDSIEENDSEQVKAPDFSLYDQYGNEHTLSDYEGKTVFLNFWATWCPPCKEEMPYIEEIYKEYGLNKDDVVVLGVASPNLGKEGSEEDIKDFLESNEYTFPVILDTTGELVYQYSISAFPSTFIIDKNGFIKQYVPGAMDKNTMKYIIGGTNMYMDKNNN